MLNSQVEHVKQIFLMFKGLLECIKEEHLCTRAVHTSTVKLSQKFVETFVKRFMGVMDKHFLVAPANIIELLKHVSLKHISQLCMNFIFCSLKLVLEYFSVFVVSTRIKRKMRKCQHTFLHSKSHLKLSCFV